MKEHAEAIGDLDDFFSFPWARLAFDILMSSIKEIDEVISKVHWCKRFRHSYSVDDGWSGSFSYLSRARSMLILRLRQRRRWRMQTETCEGHPQPWTCLSCRFESWGMLDVIVNSTNFLWIQVLKWKVNCLKLCSFTFISWGYVFDNVVVICL